MIESPGLLLAFAAGFVSFVSPCCLPLVPGYLATVNGGGSLHQRRSIDGAVLRRSLLFIGTFSLLFILLGLTVTALGSLLFDSKTTLDRFAGVAMVGMGLFFVASVYATRLNREWRSDTLIDRAERGGPVLAGAAFAVAWTPCVGPTLGAILGLAATSDGTAQGALLLAVYSVGLGLPFLLSSLAFARVTRSLAVFKRHYAAIQVGSGCVLVAMGVLVFTGQLFHLNIWGQQVLQDLHLNFFQSV